MLEILIRAKNSLEKVNSQKTFSGFISQECLAPAGTSHGLTETPHPGSPSPISATTGIILLFQPIFSYTITGNNAGTDSKHPHPLSPSYKRIIYARLFCLEIKLLLVFAYIVHRCDQKDWGGLTSYLPKGHTPFQMFKTNNVRFGHYSMLSLFSKNIIIAKQVWPFVSLTP